jgi:isoaspartyl peptidase/L-asparaginase-like protein (Ntn-hydrolase superfamily)
MSKSRRIFLQEAALIAGALGLGPAAWARFTRSANSSTKVHPFDISTPEATTPAMVSTWNHGMLANDAGFEALRSGGNALDMIEAGALLVESDAEGLSVGVGGLPDRDGHVTLDACIMDHTGNAGSVCFVQGIEHPLSLARHVMENTPHVMLSGAGAEQYARELGIPTRELLTPKAEKAWNKWREESNYAPVINRENHDTIGLLALDDQGRLAGGCTTSGVAYKMHGRVGDSPIIGAGLYVDGEFGGATATGLGEAVMRTVGSFLVVELMRNGSSPQEACEEAVHRIMKRMPTDDLQVGYLALGKNGGVGAHAIHGGFNYAHHHGTQSALIDATHG